MVKPVDQNLPPDQCTPERQGPVRAYEADSRDEVLAKALESNEDFAEVPPEEISRYIYQDDKGKFYLDSSCARLRASAWVSAQDDLTKYDAKGNPEKTKAVARSASKDLTHDVKSDVRSFNQNMSWLKVYTAELANQADNDPLWAAGAGVLFGLSSIPTAVFGNTPFLDAIGGCLRFAEGLPNVRMLSWIDKIKLLTGISRIATGLENFIIETKAQIKIKEDKGLSVETLDCLIKEGKVSQLNLKRMTLALTAATGALGALAYIWYKVQQSLDQAELAALQQAAKRRVEQAEQENAKASGLTPEPPGAAGQNGDSKPVDPEAQQRFWIEQLVQQYINREVTSLNADLMSDQSIFMREILELIKNHKYEEAKAKFAAYKEENCAQAGVMDPTYCLDPKAEQSLKNIFEAADLVLQIKSKSYIILGVGIGAVLFSMMASGDSVINSGEGIYQRFIRRPEWKAYWDGMDQRADAKADRVLQRAREIESTKQCFPTDGATQGAGAAQRIGAGAPASAGATDEELVLDEEDETAEVPVSGAAPTVSFVSRPAPAMGYLPFAELYATTPFGFSPRFLAGAPGLTPSLAGAHGGAFLVGPNGPWAATEAPFTMRYQASPEVSARPAAFRQATGMAPKTAPETAARGGISAKGFAVGAVGFTGVYLGGRYYLQSQGVSEEGLGYYDMGASATGVGMTLANPALLPFAAEGLGAAQFGSEATALTLEVTGADEVLSEPVAGLLQDVGGAVAGIGIPAATLYGTTAAGLAFPPAALVALGIGSVCYVASEVIHAYRRGRHLDEIKQDFIAQMRAQEGGEDIAAYFEQVCAELDARLNSDFGADDMAEIQRWISDAQMAPGMEKLFGMMGWWFNEVYFEPYLERVKHGSFQVSYGDSSQALKYATIQSQYGAELARTFQKMTYPGLDEAEQELSRLFGEGSRVNGEYVFDDAKLQAFANLVNNPRYEALFATPDNGQRLDGVKASVGQTLVEKYLNPWLYEVGYFKDQSWTGWGVLYEHLAGPSDGEARIGAAYGEKIALLARQMVTGERVGQVRKSAPVVPSASSASVSTVTSASSPVASERTMPKPTAEDVAKADEIFGKLMRRHEADDDGGIWNPDLTEYIVNVLTGDTHSHGVRVCLLMRWYRQVEEEIRQRSSSLGWMTEALSYGGTLDNAEKLELTKKMQDFLALMKEFSRTGSPDLIGKTYGNSNFGLATAMEDIRKILYDNSY